MNRFILLSMAAAALLANNVQSASQTFSTDTLISRYAVYSDYLAPEKLYLHLDRTAYCPGETIWFCGYLKNACPRTIYPESNFIYVELVAPDGLVEKRVKVKRDGDSFPGQICLGDDVDGGRYTLRAYTLAQIDIPAEYQFHQAVDIMGGGAGRHRRTTDALKLDVTFYPEGGRYFAGMPARIGFKVMDSAGRSVQTDASVVDESGEAVTFAPTRHDGMGDFRFLPEPGKKYFFKLPSGESYPVPAPSTEGAAVGIRNMGGRWLLSVTGVGGETYSIVLRDIVSMRPVSNVSLLDGACSMVLPDEEIRAGINHLLLVDSAGRIVSERLFFKYASDAPVAAVSFPDAEPGERVPLTARISVSNPDGTPLDGECSVSVLKASLSSCVQDDGAESYMTLSSELRGSINEPRWYFDPSQPIKVRAVGMDLLMLVQGWTYYDIVNIADPRASLGGEARRHPREMMQFVRGKVSRILSSKAPRNFTMMVMVPAKGLSCIVPVEEGRRFIMDSLDLEEGTGMLIKVSRDGHGADYIPEWDGDEFAPEFKYASAAGYAWAPREAVDVTYTDPYDTLRAAVVTARAESILGINGREMPHSDFRMYAHMNLVDYVQMKVPFKYDGSLMRSLRTNLLGGQGSYGSEDDAGEDSTVGSAGGASMIDGMWDDSPVKLVVNGTIAAWEAFADISLSEIESISISQQPDVIYNAQEGVVAIQLEYGTRVTGGSDTEPSLLYFTPLGYQAPAQFYSPRYDLGEATGDRDMRNTVYWNPCVHIPAGCSEFTFCTTDEADFPYLVQIEGFTSDGRPFSAVTTVLQP